LHTHTHQPDAIKSNKIVGLDIKALARRYVDCTIKIAGNGQRKIYKKR
jgi:hypothetical protein